MNDKRGNKEVQKIIDKVIPVILVLSFGVIMAATLIYAVSRSSNHVEALSQQTEEESGTAKGDKQITAVITEINTEDSTMALKDVASGEELILNYSGGTDFLDKYEEALTVTQLELGEVVEANFTADSKLSKVQISKKAWVYKEISKWSMDLDNQIFEIADTNYKYTDKVILFRHGEQITQEDLNQEDELTVIGYEKTIYSIIVTKGHGTIQFEDYDDFVGGTVYIGKAEILPIVKNMEVIVQEGDYEITMEHDGLKGSKSISLEAEDKVTVNMGEFKKPVTKKGKVDFVITPAGADLYIDNTLQSYENPVKLEYGTHNVIVTLGGYATYTGKISVKGNTTITIHLVESKDTSEEESTDTTTNSDSSSNGNNSSEDTNQTNSQNTSDETSEETSNKDTSSSKNNTITVKEPKGASVYLNGEYKGTAPVTFTKEIGTQYITLIKSGYITETKSVEAADDGKNLTLTYELTKSN